MNRENFFRKYDKIIESFGEAKPSILLHSCCGPCSSSVIELLAQHFEVTVLWYNPNLWPEEEFEKRLATQKQLISCLAEDGICAGLLTLPWCSEDYFSRIKGLENEPEEGKRCLECFKIRLEETARIAAERGFDWFCTTLTVSSRKDAVVINAIGRGKVIIMTTQVQNEGSDLAVYNVGHRLKGWRNVLEAYDMTTESALAKIMCILGSTKDSDEIRRAFYEPVAHDILYHCGE